MPTAINGIGTMWIGKRDCQPDGSYVTTEWIIFLQIPLIPLRSFRIKPLGPEEVSPGKFTGYLQIFRDQPFSAVRVPLSLPQVGLIYFFEVIVFGTLALFVVRSADFLCWIAAAVSAVILVLTLWFCHKHGENLS